MNIHTEIEIRSTPARVWEILTDSPSLPAWNRTVKRIEGRLVVGARVRVHMRVFGLPMVFWPRLVHAEPERELSWRGGAGALFKAHHGFRIEPRGDGTLRFVHYEDIEGLAVPLLRRGLDTLPAAYDEMNRALKARAER